MTPDKFIRIVCIVFLIDFVPTIWNLWQLTGSILVAFQLRWAGAERIVEMGWDRMRQLEPEKHA